MLYAVDLIVLSAHFFVLYWLLLNYRNLNLIDLIPNLEVMQAPASTGEYLQAYWLALCIWALLLKQRGEYQTLRVQTYGNILVNYLVNGFLFFVFFTSFSFLLKFDFLSRVFIVLMIL